MSEQGKLQKQFVDAVRKLSEEDVQKFKIDPSIRQSKNYGRDSNYESYNVDFPEPKAKTEQSEKSL